MSCSYASPAHVHPLPRFTLLGLPSRAPQYMEVMYSYVDKRVWQNYSHVAGDASKGGPTEAARLVVESMDKNRGAKTLRLALEDLSGQEGDSRKRRKCKAANEGGAAALEQ